SGSEELTAPEKGIHSSLSAIQEKTAFLPDYGFKKETPHADETPAGEEPSETWPAVNPGTSVSGLVGGLLTLCLAVIIGFVIKRRKADRT
ncbi:MAG: PDGLE domain-containing protein, partial [Desulfobacula sp.]